jgi:hypothetical protein
MTGIYEQAAANAQEGNLEPVDRRLWTAVLLQALEDWGSSNRRLHANAEEFFFQSGEDFATVCRGAGLEPVSVLTRLQQMKKNAPRRPTFDFAMAA